MAFEKKENKIIGLLLLFLVFYTFWGFLFTKTVISSSFWVYVSFGALFVGFAFVLLGEKTIKTNQEVMLWIPYLLYTLTALIFQRNGESFCYWSVCLILLLLSIKRRLYLLVPYKLLLASGAFVLFGQAVQLLLPSYYSDNILCFFTNSNQIDYWLKSYGLTGFTYQLDQAGVTLISAEAVVFSFVKNKDRKTKFLFWALLILFLVGVFLTGKRMLTVIAILVPGLIYLICNKEYKKNLLIITGLGALGIAFLCYFAININEMYNSRFFYRFAKTYMDLKNHADISTGRTELYNKAIEAFEEHPIFGIGVGKYISYTGAETAVHNTYLQVLCEQGLVGLLVYIFPLLYFLSSGIYTVVKYNGGEKKLKYYVFSLFIQMTYFLFAFTENVNINMFGYVMYFIAIAVYLSAKYDTYEDIV